MAQDWLDVSDIAPRISYDVGATPQAAFVVPFVFFSNEDLIVFVGENQKALTSDYTVSGAGNDNGGIVTLSIPVTNNTVLIRRDIAIALETHVPTFGPLDVPAVNHQFSKIIAIQQDQRDAVVGVESSIQISVTKAESAADIAAGHASSAVSQGNVPIYGTVQGLSALDIPAGINAIRLNGYASAEDGGGWYATEVDNTGPVSSSQRQSNSGTRRWQLRAKSADPRMFGAKGDGSTDDAIAFQSALNSGAKVVTPSPGNYRVASSLVVPSDVSIIGPADATAFAVSISTAENIDLLRIGGQSNSIQNVVLSHAGTGAVINANGSSYLNVDCCIIAASNASSSGNMMTFVDASLFNIRNNRINNDRPTGTGWAIFIDSATTTPPINNTITRNYFGSASTGDGVLTTNSGGTNRIEGLRIEENNFIGLGVKLFITDILSIKIRGNYFDLGKADSVILQPRNLGMQDIDIQQNYFSNPYDVNGINLKHETSFGGTIRNVRVVGNYFFLGAYGIVLRAGAYYWLIANNQFTNVDMAFNIQEANYVSVLGNMIEGAQTNFYISDGANGGPYILDANMFYPGTPGALVKTLPSKFHIGNCNVNDMAP